MCRNLTAALAAATALLSMAAVPAAAQTPGSDVSLRRVGSFTAPTDVKAPPRDPRRLFVVEQPGRVMLVRDGRKLGRPFLDITGLVQDGGERGLLSIAFAPGYSRNRLFYVFYTDNGGDLRIDEFRRSKSDANRAVRGSRRRVLFEEHSQFGNHNGGQLHFGPHDGLLYATTGDGGGAGDPFRAGQRLDTKLGKLLRIDPRRSGRRRYRVPSSNPFVARPGARPEVYAYGLRNPFRFSFAGNGDLALADVGQGEVEEVNFTRAGDARGANFGWNCFEGRRRFSSCNAPGHVQPVIERFHPENCSIIGGYFVRDRALTSLVGRYLYTDFCDGQLRSATLAIPDASGDSDTPLSVSSPTTFGRDACGRLYVASGDGPLFRLVGPRSRGCTTRRLSPP